MLFDRSALIRCELLRTRDWLLADYRGWRDANVHGSRTRHLDEPRAKAIEAVMESLIARVADALEEPSSNQAAPRFAGTAIARAAHVWQFFGRLLDQRRDLHHGPLVQLADALAADGFTHFVSAGSGKLAPPIVCVEPLDSPLTWTRGQHLPSLSLAELAFTRTVIPLPLVVVTADQLASIWSLTTVQHEIGHNVDADFGLAAVLTPQVTRAGAGHAVAWEKWLGEIVADAFGVLLAGEAFAWTLALFFERRGAWASWPQSAAAHPPARLRLEMVVRMLEKRGVPAPALSSLLTFGADAQPAIDAAELARYRKEAFAVVDAILDTPIPRFGDRTLFRTAPDAATDAGLASALADWLLSQGARPPTAGFPPRLVASAAQLAVVRGGVGAAAAVHDRAREFFDHLEAPVWQTTPEMWRHLLDSAHNTRPVDLVDDEKKPPAELFAIHEQMTFVGSSHDQLARSLEDAFAQRQGRRWKRIELFFLTDASLAPIASAGRTPDELRRDKAGTITRMQTLLPRIAESWRMAEYDHPFFFGSALDETERGRGLIHVSPYVWGANVRVCPGVNHLWNEDPPSDAYVKYREGIAYLRTIGRSIGA